LPSAEEHGGEADAGAEVPGVGRDGDQGLGGDFEQQVVDDSLVLIGDVGDRCRQSKDDMEIEMLWGERRGQGIIVAGNNRRGAPCSSRMT